jgi:hypothetical protein
LKIEKKLYIKYNEQKLKYSLKVKWSNKSKTKDKITSSRRMRKIDRYSVKISTTLSKSLPGKEKDENESDAEDKVDSMTKEQINKMKPYEMGAVDSRVTLSRTDHCDFVIYEELRIF